jgi:hypothetical protein
MRGLMGSRKTPVSSRTDAANCQERLVYSYFRYLKPLFKLFEEAFFLEFPEKSRVNEVFGFLGLAAGTRCATSSTALRIP